MADDNINSSLDHREIPQSQVLTSGSADVGEVTKLSRKKVALMALPFAIVLTILLLFLAWRMTRPVDNSNNQATDTVYEVDLGNVPTANIPLDQSERVRINGDLEANGSIIVIGSDTPDNPVPGQLYYDSTTNEMLFYNGTAFVSLQPPEIAEVNPNDILPQGLTVNDTPIFANIQISGVIPVVNGGTGVGSFTSNGVLYGNGSGDIQVTSSPTAGQILIANGSGIPVFQSISGDVTISATGTASLVQNSVGSAELTSSGVSPGTYGSSTQVARFTVNADGRVTSVSEVNIAGGGSGDILQNGNSFSAAMTIGTNDGFDLNLETSGTTRLTVDATSGDVAVLNNMDVTGSIALGSGINVDECRAPIFGVIPCDVSLSIYDGVIDNSSGTVASIANYLEVNNSSDSSNGILGALNAIELAGTNDYTNGGVGYVGSSNYGIVSTTGTVSSIYGAANYVQTTAGTVTDAYGTLSQIIEGGSGTIGTGYAYFAQNASGTGFTNTYGLYVQDQTRGTNDYGVAIEGADTYALWLGSGADNTDAANGISFGSSGDTNLYRGGANQLRTDDDLLVQTATDSTSALVVNNSAGDSVLVVDSIDNNLALYSDDSVASLGAEEITSQEFNNATFWTCGATWTTSATDATHVSGTNSCDATAANFTVTAGATYNITFTIAGMTDGVVGPNLGNRWGRNVSEDGTHTQVITATDTSDLRFVPSGTFDGTISAISVREINLSTSVLTVYDDSNQAALEVRADNGTWSTFIGHRAGEAETTGGLNIALGASALQKVTSGYENVGVGTEALYRTSTGYGNVAMGTASLRSNTDGDENTAIGYYSQYLSTTARRNTSVGSVALQSLTIGDENTGLGYQALNNTTTGSNNTGVGSNAFYYNRTGSNNTALGHSAGYRDPNVNAFVTPNDLDNSTVIGYGAQVQASNSLVLGGQDANQVNVGIGTTIPTNILSVSPIQYSTGTASQTGTTVTGSGTTWTSSMIGSEIIWADGSKATITAFGSTTSLTVDVSQSVSDQEYRIHYTGLQVDSSGNIGIGSAAPSVELDVTGDAIISGKLQVGTTNSIDQCPALFADEDCTVGLEVSTSSSESTNPTYGIYNFVGVAAPANNNELNYSSVNYINLTGTFDYDAATAVVAQASNLSTGTVMTLTGVSGSSAIIDGTVTNAIGVNGGVLQVLAGSATNAYSLYATANGGTITNNYGLHVEDQTTGSTADYGVSIAGADTYALWVGSGANNTDAANGITFGSSGDTNLYRSAANRLRTDDSLYVYRTSGTTDSSIEVGGDGDPSRLSLGFGSGYGFIGSNADIINVVDQDDNTTGNYFSWGFDGSSSTYTESLRLTEDGELTITEANQAQFTLQSDDNTVAVLEDSQSGSSEFGTLRLFGAGNETITMQATASTPSLTFDASYASISLENGGDLAVMIDDSNNGSTENGRIRLYSDSVANILLNSDDAIDSFFDAGDFGFGDQDSDAHLEVSASGGTGGNLFLLSSDDDNDGDVLSVTEAGIATLTTADGADTTTPTLTIINNETTNGESNGLLIQAGDTASDTALHVQDQTGTDSFVAVTGEGLITLQTASVHNESTAAFTFINNDGTSGQGQGVLIQAGDSTSDSPLTIESRTGTELFNINSVGFATFTAPNGGNTGFHWTFDLQDGTGSGQSQGLLVQSNATNSDAIFELQGANGSNVLYTIDTLGSAVYTVPDTGGVTTPRWTFDNNDPDSNEGHGVLISAGTSTSDYPLDVQDRAGVTLFSVDGTGQVLFQTEVDSTTGFQVLDTDGGTSVFNVDTTNERVGIGNDAPGSALDVGGDVFISEQLALGVQSYAIADSGDASPAAGTLTPTSSYVEVTCNDADGCNVTMGEGSASAGDVLYVVNISANTVNFADTAAVSELAGAFAAGQYDTMNMIYAGDRWVEISRSDN